MKWKERLQGVLIGVIATSVVLMSMPVFASSMQKVITVTYANIKLYVDGAVITPKDSAGNVVEPFIYNCTTYLPVRAISEALGKNVSWQASTKSVYIGKQPSSQTYMFDIVPAYESFSYKEYSLLNTGGADSFIMAGNKYVNGCVWDTGTVSADVYSIYNLNGQYKLITGTLGHVDGSSMVGSIMHIYKDGVLNQDIALTGDMIPKQISIDVAGVLQLKIILDDTFYMERGKYGFGNVTIQ